MIKPDSLSETEWVNCEEALRCLTRAASPINRIIATKSGAEDIAAALASAGLEVNNALTALTAAGYIPPAP